MPQDKPARTFQCKVSFDKNEIRKKIIIPSYNQARRYDNIYKALIQEFHEEGCTTSAKHFSGLVNKENSLYMSASIRDRIMDEPTLLLGLFDNCMLAEKAALLGEPNGPTICCRRLLQCILILEKYRKKFDWIMEDVFKKIIKICERVCNSGDISKESLCQIYYKYGVFLKKSDIEKSVYYLQKSFDLVRGTTWTCKELANFVGISQFSLIIANQYADALIKYANNIFVSSPEQAVLEAQKALLIIKGEGIESNMNIYFKTYLDMTALQIRAKNFKGSLQTLEKIGNIITAHLHESDEYQKFLSRYHHLKGKCYEGLHKNEIALIDLHKALEIARHSKIKLQEAIILMDIARAYIECGRSQFRMAQCCLQEAKDIFVDLKEMFNVKKTSYLLAFLKVHNIQPILLDLIKYSSVNYCDKYRLVYWKSICSPFWEDLRLKLEEEKKDPIRCLMGPGPVENRGLRRSSFQRKPPRY